MDHTELTENCRTGKGAREGIRSSHNGSAKVISSESWKITTFKTIPRGCVFNQSRVLSQRTGRELAADSRYHPLSLLGFRPKCGLFSSYRFWTRATSVFRGIIERIYPPPESPFPLPSLWFRFVNSLVDFPRKKLGSMG